MLCWRTNWPSLSIGKLSANLEVKSMYYSDPSKSPWSIVHKKIGSKLSNYPTSLFSDHVWYILTLREFHQPLEQKILPKFCPHFSGEKPRNYRRIGNQAKLLEDGRPRCRAWGSWWDPEPCPNAPKFWFLRQGQGHENGKNIYFCGVEALKQDECISYYRCISCNWCDNKDCHISMTGRVAI